MSAGLELSGFRVGITADRRADEQAALLVRLGAEVVRGPVIRTLPIGDMDRLRALTEALIAAPPDYLVANTAIGMRSWMAMAAAWGLDGELCSALRSARVAARGPKAAAAAGIAGLDVWWRAQSEQLAEVGERLTEEDLQDRRVAIQLHGDDSHGLAGLLARAGARVIEVPVYRWTLPEEVGPARRLIDQACAGLLDAITFTARPAVGNLLQLAGSEGRSGPLLEALNGDMVVACVGPVCAQAALEAGIARPVAPDHWRLGPLVRSVSDELQRRRRHFNFGEHRLVLQGRAVVVDGRAVRLSPREQAVLAELCRVPGAVTGRRTLLRQVWRRGGDTGVPNPRLPGTHVVDTTVGRLRTKLGPAGTALETVVRRGYRMRVVEDPAR